MMRADAIDGATLVLLSCVTILWVTNIWSQIKFVSNRKMLSNLVDRVSYPLVHSNQLPTLYFIETLLPKLKK